MSQQHHGDSKEKISQEQANEQTNQEMNEQARSRKGMEKKLFPPNRPSV
jgi:hypothetical protein